MELGMGLGCLIVLAIVSDCNDAKSNTACFLLV